jgi:hypothetical protein
LVCPDHVWRLLCGENASQRDWLIDAVCNTLRC